MVIHAFRSLMLSTLVYHKDLFWDEYYLTSLYIKLYYFYISTSERLCADYLKIVETIRNISNGELQQDLNRLSKWCIRRTKCLSMPKDIISLELPEKITLFRIMILKNILQFDRCVFWAFTHTILDSRIKIQQIINNFLYWIQFGMISKLIQTDFGYCLLFATFGIW